MPGIRTALSVLAASVLTASLLLASVACTPTEESAPESEARVSPPVIGEAGVLRVGVDLEYPPYAGVDKGLEAGIDIDVASALASELGLELEFAEVAPNEAASSLDAGDVDIVMSVRLDEEALAGLSFAGWYAASGPVLFASDETTISPDRLGGLDIAVQRDSEAFWVLGYELGEEVLIVTQTLREAFEGLEADEVDVVAGNAFVCAYLARDFEGVGFSSQLAPATPIGIAVRSDADELNAIVHESLDSLAAAGILDAIRAKWVGDLPQLETGEAEGS